jgi:hypothetical protein
VVDLGDQANRMELRIAVMKRNITFALLAALPLAAANLGLFVFALFLDDSGGGGRVMQVLTLPWKLLNMLGFYFLSTAGDHEMLAIFLGGYLEIATLLLVGVFITCGLQNLRKNFVHSNRTRGREYDPPV